VDAMHRTLVHGHRSATYKKRVETLVNGDSGLNLSPHNPADRQCDQLSVLAVVTQRPTHSAGSLLLSHLIIDVLLQSVS
jgi:hypothetical protein